MNTISAMPVGNSSKSYSDMSRLPGSKWEARGCHCDGETKSKLGLKGPFWLGIAGNSPMNRRVPGLVLFPSGRIGGSEHT